MDPSTPPPTPFTLTPEMLTLRRTGLHPLIFTHLGPTPATGPRRRILYDARLPLPSPSDAPGILAFLGFSPTTAETVLNAATQQFAASSSGPPPPTKQTTNPHTQQPSVEFPFARALCEVYHRMVPMGGRYGCWPATYDGFVQAGLAQGLAPEYAMSVGIHEEDERYEGEEETRAWYETTAPENVVQDMVQGRFALLSGLWRQKMEAEGALGGDAGGA